MGDVAAKTGSGKFATDRLLLSQRAIDDRYQVYSELRSEPVRRSITGTWVVTGYDAVVQLLRMPTCATPHDHARVVDRNTLRGQSISTLQSDLLPFLPSATRRVAREAVAQYLAEFQRGAIDAAAGAVTQSLDMLKQTSAPADIVHDVAGPVSMTALRNLAGTPPALDRAIEEASEALSRAAEPRLSNTEIRQIAAAYGELADAVAPSIRGSSRFRLTDYLADFRSADGSRIPDRLICPTACFVLMAGQETTKSLIATTVFCVFRDAGAFKRLRDDPSLTGRAVDEALRFESPVQATTRLAETDVEVCGATIPRRSLMLLLLGSANRDPAAFEEPDEYRIERQGGRPVAFGGGAFACLGAALARAEATCVLGQLMADDELIDRVRISKISWDRLLMMRRLSQFLVELHA